MGFERICLNAAVVILLGLIHKSQCSTYLSDHVQIFKCCPQGSDLKVITDASGIKTDYDCSIRSITSGGGENNQTLFGYNLVVTDESHIPKCGDVKLFDFNIDADLISKNGCIDMYNGLLHGLTCSDEFQVDVHTLFKCCAEGRTKCLLCCKEIYKFLYPLNGYKHLIIKLFN